MAGGGEGSGAEVRLQWGWLGCRALVLSWVGGWSGGWALGLAKQ